MTPLFALVLWFVIWLAFGCTPFIVLARLFLFLEAALVLGFEIARAGVFRWAETVLVRYRAVKIAEAGMVKEAN